MPVNMMIIKDMSRDVEVCGKCRIMEEEAKNTKRKNDILVNEWLTSGAEIIELKSIVRMHEEKITKMKKNHKRKVKMIKKIYEDEIVLLKSKLYDNNNIYELKIIKPQNIVKVS